MTIATTESTQPTSQVAAATGAHLIREAAAVMEDAYTLAKVVCQTAMVPKHFQGKPEDTAAAMLYGASLGLDPMQSVRAVYVVHGQPGLAARSMDALTKGAGHETWTVESTDESVTVAGRRRGSERVEQVTWTIDRATKAGYVPTIDPSTGNYRLNKWGKIDGNEKYLTDPQAMLHAKATAEVCRKIAPDVLSGVYAVEELQSERIYIEQPPARGLGAVLAQPVEAEPVEVPHESPLLNTSSKLARKMFALFGQIGLTEKADRLAYVGDVIGRQVGSSSEMTDADAVAVIAALEADQAAAPAERVDVTTGEIVEAEIVTDPATEYDPTTAPGWGEK